MYRSVIPPVQGLAFGPNGLGPQQNPLEALGNAYGVWYGAMEYDPSGQFARSVVQNAVWSAAVFAGVGYVLPAFTAAEGAKWGALAGAILTIGQFMKQRGAP